MVAESTDGEPEPEIAEPKRAKQADAPAVDREPDAEALKESVEPELTHPRPEPKPRGRESPPR